MTPAGHRAEAVRLLAEAEARTSAIVAGPVAELTTQRVLADRVRSKRDLLAAVVAVAGLAASDVDADGEHNYSPPTIPAMPEPTRATAQVPTQRSTS